VHKRFHPAPSVQNISNEKGDGKVPSVRTADRSFSRYNSRHACALVEKENEFAVEKSTDHTQRLCYAIAVLDQALDAEMGGNLINAAAGLQSVWKAEGRHRAPVGWCQTSPGGLQPISLGGAKQWIERASRPAATESRAGGPASTSTPAKNHSANTPGEC
jgi:hypothetical protein